MDETRIYACAICGEDRFSDQPWFLVAENSWEDKLKILRWNGRVAAQQGVHCACGSAHVQELVVHWMATGSLDYPFARVGLGCRRIERRHRIALPGRLDADTSGASQIGELAVHRESMERLLVENPQSLNAILQALLRALEQEPVGTAAEVRSEEKLDPVVRQF